MVLPGNTTSVPFDVGMTAVLFGNISVSLQDFCKDRKPATKMHELYSKRTF
jgi:hypothetical protein